MPYHNNNTLKKMGFKSIGKDVQVSTLCSVYNTEKIEIGDYSRIDDFCVLSGCLKIGMNVHITPQCLIAGGTPGVFIDDFATIIISWVF